MNKVNTSENNQKENDSPTSPKTSWDSWDENRRLKYETAYPQVSVLFDEETVRSMNWKAVFGF